MLEANVFDLILLSVGKPIAALEARFLLLRKRMKHKSSIALAVDWGRKGVP